MRGYSLAEPKLRGDTGMVEIGLALTPKTARQGWSLDVGLQTYVGKHEGVTGSLRARYQF